MKTRLKSSSLDNTILLSFLLLFNFLSAAPFHNEKQNKNDEIKTIDTPHKLDLVIRKILEDLLNRAIKRHKGGGNSTDFPVVNRRLVHLLSKTGFFLAMTSSGKVFGNKNITKDCKMELQVLTPRVKRIKHVPTGKYLAINKHGKVVSKDKPDLETLLYEEQMEDLSTTYSSLLLPKSKSFPKWYFGLYTSKSRKAKVRRASRTLPSDSATHFFVLYA